MQLNALALMLCLYRPYKARALAFAVIAGKTPCQARRLGAILLGFNAKNCSVEFYAVGDGSQLL